MCLRLNLAIGGFSRKVRQTVISIRLALKRIRISGSFPSIKLHGGSSQLTKSCPNSNPLLKFPLSGSLLTSWDLLSSSFPSKKLRISQDFYKQTPWRTWACTIRKKWSSSFTKKWTGCEVDLSKIRLLSQENNKLENMWPPSARYFTWAVGSQKLMKKRNN